MKPKRNFGFGLLKYSDSANYIEHEKINHSDTCITLKEVIDTNEIKLSDIPKLQNEVENIASILGYRMLNLRALLDGLPLKIENKSMNTSKFSNYLQFFVLPKTENGKLEIEKNKNKTAVVLNEDMQADQSFSQVLPELKKDLRNINSKRKMSYNTKVPKVKRQKSSQVNCKSDFNAKPSYEIPNKFWELMEPYCCEINDQHLKFLSNYMQAYENDAKYYEIPDVKTVSEPIPEISSINGTPKRSNLNGFAEKKNGIDLSNLLKNIDNKIRKPLSESLALKNFPQNLVNAMSQETNDLITKHKLYVNNQKNDISSDMTSLAKQLKVSNSYKIEKFIKKSMDELGMCNFNLPFIPKLEPQFNLCTVSEQQGIAQSNDSDPIDQIILDDVLPNSLRKTVCDNVNEDKALFGLRRRQAELKLVSESNLGMLNRLMVVAKRDVKRQEIERRLAIANADVIESYNVIESYRPACRAPLKKDRDMAYKSLRDRQKILKELEAFDSEFL